MKYVDASALLRALFQEEGPTVPLASGDRIVSSRLVEIETFRAIDRARLVGSLTDLETALKRKDLIEVLDRLDLAPIDDEVIRRARDPFGVNVRALDAIHVATAEILAAEAGVEPFEFWTHDGRQATAALSRGLTVRGV
jgi:predicted nucleic acid-binding protein